MVKQQSPVAVGSDGSVTPHRCCGKTIGQDLLRKLLYGNLIIVNVFAPSLRDCSGPGHDRRNKQRCLIFGNPEWIQRPARKLSNGLTSLGTNEQADATGCESPKKVPSTRHSVLSLCGEMSRLAAAECILRFAVSASQEYDWTVGTKPSRRTSGGNSGGFLIRVNKAADRARRPRRIPSNAIDRSHMRHTAFRAGTGRSNCSSVSSRRRATGPYE
jgi:hypothetical protein